MNQVIYRAVLAVSAIILSLSHSSLWAEGHDGKIRVLSSIKPLSLIVRDIGGEYVSAESLIEGGASPHHFSLTFSQLRNIKEASLLVWVGPKMEGFLTKALSNLASTQQLITVSELPGMSWPETHSSGHHDHDVDMHVWLGRINAIEIAKGICAQLSELLPDQKGYFEERLQQFAQSLSLQSEQALVRFNAIAQKRFGVYHDGYAHFIADYNLIQEGHFTLVPDEQISIKRLLQLKSDLKDVSCLIAEIGESSKAQKYANKLSLPLMEIDLLASAIPDDVNFMGYMRSVISTFEACFMKVRSGS